MSSRSRHKRTAPRLDRRRLIQVGGLGLLGLGLPKLLSAERTSGSAKSCILLVLSGGLSHIDTFDPKPQAPEEIRGPYKPIATRSADLRVTEMLPLLAEVSPLYSIVRSLSHTEVPHVTAAHMMLTGQPDGTTQNNSPFIGSLVSKFRPSAANMPSYVWLHNMKTGTNKVPRYNSGLNTIGHQHAPLRVGYELDNPTDPNFRVRAFDPAEGLTQQQLSDRTHLLRQIESIGSRVSNSAAADEYRTYQDRARDLVTGPDARRAFDLQREPDQVRDRYGRHPMGQYLLMARRLVEAGVRLVTVTGWPGLAPGETTPTVTQVWDMHDDRYKGGDSMFGDGPFGMKWSLPRFDQGLSALLEDLQQCGLLDSTLVAVMTEFGRTPKFEGKGKGRGHWPHCYSALLAGGGIRGGTVYGASDSQGAFVAEGRPLNHADFAATIYHALGIPPETRFGPDGFSLRLSAGEPLHELFA